MYVLFTINSILLTLFFERNFLFKYKGSFITFSEKIRIITKKIYSLESWEKSVIPEERCEYPVSLVLCYLLKGNVRSVIIIKILK